MGSCFTLGGKELEVDCSIQKAEFTSGKCFNGQCEMASPQPSIRNSNATLKAFKPLRPNTLNGPKASSRLSLNPLPKKVPIAASGTENDNQRKSFKCENRFWTANWYGITHISAFFAYTFLGESPSKGSIRHGMEMRLLSTKGTSSRWYQRRESCAYLVMLFHDLIFTITPII